MWGLILTILCGLFFLIGIYVSKIIDKHHEFEIISIGLSFVVLLNLLFLDICPEINFSIKGIIFILLGLALLKLMDLFVPEHHHDHHEEHDNKKEHEEHQEHISIITILALTLHNILECIALYNLTNESVTSGLSMALAIGLHNIPLGMQIGSKLKKHKLLYNLVLTLSGFVGGVIAFNFGQMSAVIENYFLCFTMGMLLYLTFFEIFVELLHYLKNKYLYYGIIIGVILIVFTNLL